MQDVPEFLEEELDLCDPVRPRAEDLVGESLLLSTYSLQYILPGKRWINWYTTDSWVN